MERLCQIFQGKNGPFSRSSSYPDDSWLDPGTRVMAIHLNTLHSFTDIGYCDIQYNRYPSYSYPSKNVYVESLLDV